MIEIPDGSFDLATDGKTLDKQKHHIGLFEVDREASTSREYILKLISKIDLAELTDGNALLIVDAWPNFDGKLKDPQLLITRFREKFTEIIKRNQSPTINAEEILRAYLEAIKTLDDNYDTRLGKLLEIETWSNLLNYFSIPVLPNLIAEMKQDGSKLSLAEEYEENARRWSKEGEKVNGQHKESDQEKTPNREIKNVEGFAQAIVELRQLLEKIISDPDDDRVPTIDELHEIESRLIELWNEVGLDEVSPLISEALQPLFVTPDSKTRFHEASVEYKVVIKELPYVVADGEKFLSIIKDERELKRFMLADITNSVRYIFLLQFNAWINPPPPEPIRHKDKHNDGYDRFESSSKIKKFGPVYSEDDKKHAREMVENQEQQIDFRGLSHELFIAYKDQLTTYANSVIGCDHIRWGLMGYGDPEEIKAFDVVLNESIKEAQTYIFAKSQLAVFQKFEQSSLDQLVTYTRLIEAVGPHSKLGKFYRKQVEQISRLLYGDLSANSEDEIDGFMADNPNLDHLDKKTELSREDRIKEARKNGTLRLWAGRVFSVPGDIFYYESIPVPAETNDSVSDATSENARSLKQFFTDILSRIKIRWQHRRE